MFRFLNPPPNNVSSRTMLFLMAVGLILGVCISEDL